MTTVFEHLAAWSSTLRLADVPESARESARRAITDFVGVTFAARGTDVDDVVRTYLQLHGAAAESDDRRPATVIGLGLHAPAEAAAFANGTMGHALDFDDGSDAMRGHPSAVIVPAVLAAAQLRGHASGADVLEAYIAGFEVGAKIGHALGPTHRERGWNATATVCLYAGVAAAARMLRLDAETTARALGMASASAAGNAAHTGTMGKPLFVGRTAQAALFCGLIAQAGGTTNPAGFEHPFGFATLYQGLNEAGRAAAVEQLLRPVNATWDLMTTGVSLKPFPCCGMAHVGIDAALQIRDQLGGGVSADDIASVDIRLHPVKLPPVNRPVVTSNTQALFSVQYVVAVALLYGAVGVADFTPEAAARDDVRRLMARTNAGELDHDRAPDGPYPGEVTVTMKDGRAMHARIEGPRGNGSGHPLTDDDVHAKFVDCCASAGVDQDRIDTLYRTLRRIDEVDDLNQLTSLLA